ncbi:MFS transporter [Streptomyces sp. NPDC015127]|uniref:MFS transporter n=1 Tax=Streptomyces sp. NPDC015127 TaxID=3364939 RepID=UPI0036F84E86
MTASHGERIRIRFQTRYGVLPAGTKGLFSAQLICAVGSGMTTPMLVIYLHTIRGLPLALSASISMVAALVSLAGNPAGGWLADRSGARATSVLGLLIAASGTGALAPVTTSGWAIGAVALLGLGLSIAYPALNALLGHLAPADSLNKSFALQYMLRNIGYGVGGLAAAVIAGRASPGIFQLLYLIDALSFIAAAGLVLRVPTRGRAAAAPEQAKSQGPLESFTVVMRDSRFRRLWLINLAISIIAFSQLHTGFVAYATTYTHVTPRIIGIAYLANTLTVILAQMPILTVVNKRARPTVLTALCTCMTIPIALVYTSAHTPRIIGILLLITAPAILAIGETLYAASIPAMVNEFAPSHLRGQYNGALILAFTVGNLLGPAISGFLLSSHLPLPWILIMLTISLIAIGAAALTSSRAKLGAHSWK